MHLFLCICICLLIFTNKVSDVLLKHLNDLLASIYPINISFFKLYLSQWKHRRFYDENLQELKLKFDTMFLTISDMFSLFFESIHYQLSKL